MIWKILDLISKDGAITQVKYSVTKDSVSTEGYWTFKNKNHKVVEQLSEIDVINWIKAESIINDVCIIEDNLQKQLNNVQNVVKKPWIIPTFTVKI